GEASPLRVRARAGHQRVGNPPNRYSPQSSSASGASASAAGAVSFTSSSAPQSGQETISPFTASDPTVTSASHSGHFGTAFPSSVTRFARVSPDGGSSL